MTKRAKQAPLNLDMTAYLPHEHEELLKLVDRRRQALVKRLAAAVPGATAAS